MLFKWMTSLFNVNMGCVICLEWSHTRYEDSLVPHVSHVHVSITCVANYVLNAKCTEKIAIFNEIICTCCNILNVKLNLICKIMPFV